MDPVPHDNSNVDVTTADIYSVSESFYSSLHSATQPTSEGEIPAPSFSDPQIDAPNSNENVRAPEPCTPTSSTMAIYKRTCTPPPWCPNCCGLDLDSNKCHLNCHQSGKPSTILESEYLTSDRPCLPQGTTQLINGGYVHAPDIVPSHSQKAKFNGNDKTKATNVTKVLPVIRLVPDSNDAAEDSETIPKIISESPDTIPKIIYEICGESGAVSHQQVTDNNIHNDNRPGIHDAFQSLRLCEHHKCSCPTKSPGKQDHAENSYLSLVDDSNISSSLNLANDNCSETKRKSLGEGVIYPESICEECARGFSSLKIPEPDTKRSSVVEMRDDSLQPVSNENSLGQLSRESSSYIGSSLPQANRISNSPDSSLSIGNGSGNYVD